MAVTYEPASPAIHALVADLAARHHQELVDAGVTYLILLARANDESKPALKHHGYPACAVVNVVNLKDRVAGLPDARILLDGDHWNGWHESKQRAILDHELEHLEVKRDDQGRVDRDDVGRPKLKLRPHDFEVGVFNDIMDRHREFAVETQAAATLSRKLAELQLPSA